MRVPLLQAASIGVVTLALVGCSSTDEDVADENTPQVVESTSEPGREPTEESDAESSQLNLVSCDEAELKAVSSVIAQQTQAFGDRDFDTAYSLASPSFRDAVPIEVFQQLIDSSYGTLILSSDLNFEECRIERDRDFATIDVRFNQGGQDVFGLQYVVTNTHEGWRINAASNLAVVGASA